MARQVSIAPQTYDRSNEQVTRTTLEQRLTDIESALSGLRTSYGTFAVGEGSVILSNGANNNVYPDYYTFARITGPTGSFSITGFRQGERGRLLMIRNTTAQQMTIANESGSSTAENRIITNTGADVVISSLGFVTLVYDATSQRWIVAATQG